MDRDPTIVTKFYTPEEIQKEVLRVQLEEASAEAKELDRQALEALGKAPKAKKAVPKEGISQTYTFEEFARRVGIDIRTLRRHIKQGILSPHKIGKGRGQKTEFLSSQVAEYTAKRQEIIRAGDGRFAAANKKVVRPLLVADGQDIYSGAEAQKCYRKFNAGLDDIDIVLETGMHPGVVAGLRRMYMKQRHQLVLTKPILDRIALLPLDGPVPPPGKPWTELAFYEVLKLAVAPQICTSCKKGTRKFCQGCIDKAKTETHKSETANVPEETPAESLPA